MKKLDKPKKPNKCKGLWSNRSMNKIYIRSKKP